MKREIDAIALGATLFVPANHKNLQDILSRKRFTNLRSLVIDTEDGLHVKELERVLERIKILLDDYQSSELFVFIRPKNTEVLQKLLHVKGIEKCDGFILPKFSLENMSGYLDLLQRHDFYIMPSIEGEELFNPQSLHLIKNYLDQFKEKILLIRFGAEDMFRQLGLRRSQTLSIYEMLAPSLVMANLLTVFKASGYDISAPVYPFYKDELGFIAEVKRDLLEGFISKTVIHPSQIDLSEKLYAVTSSELISAQKILETTQKSLFGENGVMHEVPTQSPWAKKILARYRYYGATDT
ncbi:MAG: HpcH/HpaI aldolase/citrate lyase family protein [Campylobacterota bacterium]|nr:HpcH/HpaI aldolase/citrate lyase family protein [Campylobacterota bacterium]